MRKCIIPITILFTLLFSSCSSDNQMKSDVFTIGSRENISAIAASLSSKGSTSGISARGASDELVAITLEGRTERVRVLDANGNDVTEAMQIIYRDTLGQFDFLLFSTGPMDWPFSDMAYVPSAGERGADFYILDRESGRFYLIDGLVVNHKLRTSALGAAAYGNRMALLEWSWKTDNSFPVGVLFFTFNDDGSMDAERVESGEFYGGVELFLDRYGNLIWDDMVMKAADRSIAKLDCYARYGYNGIAYYYDSESMEYRELDENGELVKSEYVPEYFQERLVNNYGYEDQSYHTIIRPVRQIRHGNVVYYHHEPLFSQGDSSASLIMRAEYDPENDRYYEAEGFKIQKSLLEDTGSGYVITEVPIAAVTDKICSYTPNMICVIDTEDGAETRIYMDQYDVSRIYAMAGNTDGTFTFIGEDSNSLKVTGRILKDGTVTIITRTPGDGSVLYSPQSMTR